MDEFTSAIQGLNEAVISETREKEEPDAYLYATIALKAVGINDYLRSVGMGEPFSLDLSSELRKQIHTAFGAPGDFGYGTPVGKALQRLYSIKL